MTKFLCATAMFGCLIAGPASAEVFGSAVNQNFVKGEVLSNLPLSPGVFSIEFKTVKPQVVLITFSAECGLSSPTGAVSIDILVDGIAVPPTAGKTDYFCAGQIFSSINESATHSITVPVRLNAGSHSLRVQAQPVDAPARATFWIDDSATVVFD